MKRWMASMGLFWSALALALLAGCGAGAESSGTPNPNPAPAPNASGAALFAQHGCAGCHGANGLGMTISSGTSPDNPPTVIPALTAAATLAELTTIISTSMPPQTPGVCSGTCATQLAQYVYDTFTDKAPPAPTGASAKGTEGYAGIPGNLISSSDPALLEDLVRDNGFGNQPNQFNSGNIENQVNQTTGQPQNNNVPGTSAAWNTIFNRAVAGQAIPVPCHDIKITEAATLATMTQAYTSFRNGGPATALPDLREVFKTSRLFEIAGIAPRPGLDGAGIVTEMCTQCHKSTLDQNITRARFNVNLAAMSNGSGGVLTPVERDAEIGLAIRRMLMPAIDVRKMPPESMKTMSLAEINLVASYLCTQATTRNSIPECTGR